eukprot:4539020-Pyramimonas_sp.AAC.1
MLGTCVRHRGAEHVGEGGQRCQGVGLPYSSPPPHRCRAIRRARGLRRQLGGEFGHVRLSNVHVAPVLHHLGQNAEAHRGGVVGIPELRVL